MPIEIIRIPQLGEGLQEALLVEYLVQPGTRVERDQPLYVMETDKATAEVESSFEGEIVEWLVEPGVVLEIGAEIGRIQTSVASGSESSAEASQDEVAQESVESLSESVAEDVAPADEAEKSVAAPAGRSAEKSSDKVLRLDAAQSIQRPEVGQQRKRFAESVRVPPRTRRHLQQLGLSDRIDEIPTRGKKMLPEDVDRYVTQSALSTASELIESIDDSPKVNRVNAGQGEFSETAIPRHQLTLNYRLLRGLQQVVPATAVIEVDWSRFAEARELNRADNGPTGFMMMLWCVTRSLVRFPKLRSTLVQDGRVQRTFDNVSLGVAVALPDDSLVTAVIPEANKLSPAEFWRVASERIALARNGKDQASEQVTFTVSNVGTFGLDMGIPVVVPPAVATMCLGRVAPHPVPDGDSWQFCPKAPLALTFDHRIVNGLGAGQFLADLKREIDEFSWNDLAGK